MGGVGMFRDPLSYPPQLWEIRFCLIPILYEIADYASSSHPPLSRGTADGGLNSLNFICSIAKHRYYDFYRLILAILKLQQFVWKSALAQMVWQSLRQHPLTQNRFYRLVRRWR